MQRFERAVPCPGGASRQESVQIGLQYLQDKLSASSDDLVLIHDAARCLISPPLISGLVKACEKSGASAPVLAVNDTVKRLRPPGSISQTVDRAALYRVQTPQAFRFGLISDAHQQSMLDDRITDDCSLIEQDREITAVWGDPNNIKITTPDDLAFAEWVLAREPSESELVGKAVEFNL